MMMPLLEALEMGSVDCQLLLTAFDDQWFDTDKEE